jgi:hypothetical protein
MTNTRRTYNPAWHDSREARAARQAKRQAKLDEIAAGLGYATWRKLETAVINGKAVITLTPVED